LFLVERTWSQGGLALSAIVIAPEQWYCANELLLLEDGVFAQVVAELHGLLDASAYLSDIRIFAVVEVASHHFVCARCLDEFEGSAVIIRILRRDDLGNSSLFPV
jgi:hypothetical protein